MNWSHRNLKQKITYWAPSTPDGYGGRTFSTPQQTRGRWEKRTDVVTDNAGNSIVSEATVYLKIEVVPEGYLYNGASTAADPTTLDGAREIKQAEKTPTLSAQNFLWKIFL